MEHWKSRLNGRGFNMSNKVAGALFLSILLSKVSVAQEVNLVSIEHLVEQEIGRIIVGQIYDTLQVEYTVEALPGKRAALKLKKGAVDGEVMRIYSYGENNPNVIRIPTPYYSLETMPFHRIGEIVDIKNSTDLKHYRIAIVRGVRHTANITRDSPNVIKLNSTEQAMRFVLRGRADIALTNTIDGLSVLASYNLKNITHLDKPLKTEALYHYLHKKHKKTAAIFNNKVLELKKSGKLVNMIKNAEIAVLRK
jgi:ABC-type amino acid transport substrate-binding protein